MSKSKKATKEVEVVEEKVEVEEVVEEEVEEVVEEEVEEVVEEEKVLEADDEIGDNTNTRTKRVATVVNCKRLNVRGEPNRDSEIVSVIDLGTEVIINVEKSTPQFYSVSTLAGVTGFCMVGYISEQ